MRSKVSVGVTLTISLVVLFGVLASSISSIFNDIGLVPAETSGIRQEAIVDVVKPPASVTGSLPMTSSTTTSEVTPDADSKPKPLANWPEGLKPLENYALKVEYTMEDSYRWGLEIQGNINIIIGAIVTDMRDQGWEVEVLYSYLGIEVLGTYGDAKMSLFVDTLLSGENNWSPITVIYQKAPIPYQAPPTTAPYKPNSKS